MIERRGRVYKMTYVGPLVYPDDLVNYGRVEKTMPAILRGVCTCELREPFRIGGEEVRFYTKNCPAHRDDYTALLALWVSMGTDKTINVPHGRFVKMGK